MRTAESNQLARVQVIRWRMGQREWQQKILYGSLVNAPCFALKVRAA